MLRAALRSRRAILQLSAQYERSSLTSCSQCPSLTVDGPQAQQPFQYARSFAKQPPNSEIPRDSEHVNMENEIDKEIMRAHDKGTPEAIFEVVKNFGEEFGQTNTCTSLKHLGDLVKQQPDLKDKILPSNEFEVLLNMVLMGRRKYDITQLSGVVQSLGDLHYDSDVMLDRLSQHIMDKLDKASAVDLTQLGTALASLDHSPSVVLFEAIQDRAAALDKGSFKKDQKAALEKAFQKFEYKHDKISKL